MPDTSFDQDKYAQMLVWARPAIIEDPEEHDRLLGVAEQLMDKGEDLSPEEQKLLALVVFLIEAFEAEVEEQESEETGDDESGVHRPAEPHETLHRLLESRGLDLADIVDVFGNPQNARDVVNGQRQITRGEAKQLARFFGVPAKIFLP